MLKRKAMAFISIAVTSTVIASATIAFACVPDVNFVYAKHAPTTNLIMEANVGDVELVNSLTKSTVPIEFSGNEFKMLANIQKITSIKFEGIATDGFKYRNAYVFVDNRPEDVCYDVEQVLEAGNELAFADPYPTRIYATPKTPDKSFTKVTITYNCETNGAHHKKLMKEPGAWYLIGDGSFMDPLNRSLTWCVEGGLKLDSNMSVTASFKKGDYFSFGSSEAGHYKVNNAGGVCGYWTCLAYKNEWVNDKEKTTFEVKENCNLNLKLVNGDLHVSVATPTNVKFILKDSSTDAATTLNENSYSLRGTFNGWAFDTNQFKLENDGTYTFSVSIDSNNDGHKVDFVLANGDWTKKVAGIGDSNLSYRTFGADYTLTIKFSFAEFNKEENVKLVADISQTFA